MKVLISKIHLLIIAYAGYVVFEYYEAFEAKMADYAKEVPLIQKEIKTKKRKLSDIKKFEEEIDVAKDRMAKAKDHFRKLEQQLPRTMSDFQIKENLKSTLEELNLMNVNIVPAPELFKDFYYSKTYVVKGTGTFLQFLVFIENMARNERIFNIDTLKFVRSKEKVRGRYQLIDAEINVETYRQSGG